MRKLIALAVAAFVLAAGFVAIVSSVLGGTMATLNQNTAMACAPATTPGVTLSAANLDAAQLANAAIIVQQGEAAGAGTQGEIIGIATGLVESNLRLLANSNVPASLAYPNQGVGDNDDSLGVFQQRISQGWGTVAQEMSGVTYEAQQFFSRLVKLPNWPPPADATAAELGAYAQSVQRSAAPDAYAGQIPVATQLVDSAASTTTVAATSGGVPAAPSGPPTPAGGWSTEFADDFQVPFGQDPLWQDSPGGPNNPQFESEVYSGSQVNAGGGQLQLTATPNGGGFVSGRVMTNWTWTPGEGDTWAFQLVAKFPTSAGLFNAFWTSSRDGWSDERDFFEGSPHGSGLIDSDWIYQTGTTGTPKAQDWYLGNLGFDPSVGDHTYTYLIYPNQSWSLYVDGKLQTWVGNNGVAPVRQSQNVPMDIILNYALAGGGPGGPSTFDIKSVAAYQDTPHAGDGVSSKALGPGTAIGAGGGPALTNCTTTVAAPHIVLPNLPKGAKLPAAVVADIGKAPVAVQKAISFALKQLGDKYVFGGTGPPAPGQPAVWDCSGLVQGAYASAGISLQRTTYQQVLQGVAVLSAADLRPGDLVFPESDLSHVQIYLGSGWIVEAPQTGDVVHVVKLWGFSTARRIVSE